MSDKLNKALILLDELSTLVYNIDAPATGSGYAELLAYVDNEVYEFILEEKHEQ